VYNEALTYWTTIRSFQCRTWRWRKWTAWRRRTRGSVWGIAGNCDTRTAAWKSGTRQATKHSFSIHSFQKL